METIKKTINIDVYRNKEFNFIPFIPYGGEPSVIQPEYDDESEKWITTNYGGFCLNPVYDGEELDYISIFRAYAELRKKMADGVRLKKIDGIPPDCDSDIFNNYTCVYAPCSESAGKFVPKELSDFVQINEVNYAETGDCGDDEYIVLVDGIPAGSDLYDKISGGTDSYKAPYLSIPVLLTQDYSRIGMMTNYDYTIDDSGNTVEFVQSDDSILIGEIDYSKKYVTEEESQLESKLYTLRNNDIFYDESSGEGLEFSFNRFKSTGEPGFHPINDGSIYGSQGMKLTYYTGYTTATTNCTVEVNTWVLSGDTYIPSGVTTRGMVHYTYPYPKERNCYKIYSNELDRPEPEYNYQYPVYPETSRTETTTVTKEVSWIEAVKAAIPSTAKPLSKLPDANNQSYYASFSLVDSAAKTIGLEGHSDGQFWLVMIAFENGPIYPSVGPEGEIVYGNVVYADYPFIEGYNIMISNTSYNVVDKITESGNTVEFVYTLGADLNSDTSGVTYKETYNFNPNYSGDTITVDGMSGIRVYYKKIFYGISEVEVYSDKFHLTRDVNVSTTNSFMGNTIWDKDDGVGRVVPAFADDSGIVFDFEPSIGAGLEIDRGMATAFESHYKLMECNTLQDLEEYGNSFFFL